MASVLTQAPLPAPHGPRHTITKAVVAPSSSSMMAATTTKARVAETRHLEYASPSQGADDIAEGEVSDSSSSCSNDSEEPQSGRPRAAPSEAYSDAGHYSGYSRTKDHPPSRATARSYAYSSADRRRSKYDELADALTRDPPPVLSTPPPVPPKTNLGHKLQSKSVSIVAPSDLLDYRQDSRSAFDYTVSEPGHGSTSTASTSASRSDRAPHQTMYTTQPSSRYPTSAYNYPSRLSWADKASVPIYRHSFPMANKPSPARPESFPGSPSQPGKKKLKKALARPSVATPSSPPGSTSRIWRALSLRGTSSTPSDPSRLSSASGSSSSKFFRTICHSVSEHGHFNEPSFTSTVRPSIQSHDSGGSSNAASNSHSSSTSHSPCLSSSHSSATYSTPPTTPDDIFPTLLPLESSVVGCVPELIEEEEELPTMPIAPQPSRGASTTAGTAGRKLRKRRPSQSLTNVPARPEAPTSGLRRSKTQAQTHIGACPSSGLLPPINPEAPFGLEIPNELTQANRSGFPGNLLSERKKKSSTNALAQLAWTGLSSSELAAITSRLNIQKHSPERAAQLAKQELQEQPGAFDPYGESLYASGGNPKSTQINKVGDVQQDQNEGTGSSIGHAVTTTLSAMRKKMAPTQEIRPGHKSATESSTLSMQHTRPDSDSNTSSHAPSSHASSQPARRPQRASFLENDPMAMRRWTLAMAEVPDEVLVQELDKLWKEGASRRGRGTKTNTPASSQTGHGSDCGGGETRSSVGDHNTSALHWKTSVHFHLGAESDSEDEDVEGTVEEPEDEANEAEWKTAQRALLCCRELVRTERSYQVRLRQLLDAESSHPRFSLLLSYVPALLKASEALLVRLVDDPSAWGVSAAFIGCEEELEAAFVSWCGIVGDFFVDEEKDKRGRKPARKASEEVASAHDHGEVSVRQKISITTTTSPGIGARSMSQGRLALAKQKPPEARRLSLFGVGENGGMFTSALGTGLALGLSPTSPSHGFGKHGSTTNVGKEYGHGATGTLTRTLSAWKRKSMPSSLYHLPSSIGLTPPNSPTSEEKKLAVRDLAIQPTQRVMRYVLQYKDLLAHTPVSSPSRGLVERALESALRIAKKCDRAQGNSAFLRRP